MTAPTPLSVSCPSCHALPGVACAGLSFDYPHEERIEALYNALRREPAPKPRPARQLYGEELDD